MSLEDEIGFDRLDYQSNYDRFAARLVMGRNIESDRSFINSVKESHTLAVDDALMNLNFDAMEIVSKVRLEEKSNYFFQYGVMRRLSMLQVSFRIFKKYYYARSS
jgi:hypothetical protein